MALTLALTAMAQSEVTRTAYNKAVEAWAAKDFTVAAASFTEVIEKGMDDEGAAQLVATAKSNLPVCYRRIGIAHARTKNYEAAIESLTKCIQYAELYDAITEINNAKSAISKVYQAQGGNAFNNKNFAAAAPIFEKGVKANPRNTEMMTWLGICYCEMGDITKGMTYLDKVVAMGTTNPQRYGADAAKAKGEINRFINNQIVELQTAKNYNGIISMANEMLATDPTNATAAFIRLQAYMDKKDYNKVIELGEGVASRQPTAVEKSNVYFILGAAYNAKDNKSQALATLKRVTAGDKVTAAKATITELEEALAQ